MDAFVDAVVCVVVAIAAFVAIGETIKSMWCVNKDYFTLVVLVVLYSPFMSKRTVDTAQVSTHTTHTHKSEKQINIRTSNVGTSVHIKFSQV